MDRVKIPITLKRNDQKEEGSRGGLSCWVTHTHTDSISLQIRLANTLIKPNKIMLLKSTPVIIFLSLK